MVDTEVAIMQGSKGVIKKWVRVLSANKPASTIMKKKFNGYIVQDGQSLV